jgi:hypothetical protein
MKQSIKSPYTKMYMVTPSVYEKLLNCIDDKQKKILNNLNQKTTNIFHETPANKFIKNISNDDFIQGNNDQPKQYYPEPMSPSSEEEQTIPPGYRDEDFIPSTDEPNYEYDPSMPIIEDITPSEQYHTIENQPKHVEIPMDVSHTTSQGVQTETPSHSEFTQTEIPTQSQSTQTQGPIYMERGTSPILFPEKKKPKNVTKLKRLQYKQPKAVTFKRKKLKITELPHEDEPMTEDIQIPEYTPMQESIQYQPKLPISYKVRKPLQYSKLHQKKLTTIQPKKLTFKRKKLVITEMEPDNDQPMQQIPQEQITYEKKLPISHKEKLSISHKAKLPISFKPHKAKLPISFKPKKAIAHKKKEAIQYLKPIIDNPNIVKEILHQPSTSYQTVKLQPKKPLILTVPTNVPEITDQTIKLKPKKPIIVTVPTDIPEITDQTSKKALKYIPKNTKKLEHNPDTKPYPCDECNLSYTTKFGLNRHKKNKHSEKNIQQEKFQTWVQYPQKRTSTYAKIKTPPTKYKKKEDEFESWN